MANTTIKITQLPSIGNGLSASTILPVVNTSGTAVTEKVSVGAVANFALTEAGNTLEPAFLSTIAYSVANAAQPNITSVGNLTGLTLTNLANFHVPGGTNGYVLQTDGTGNLSWVAGGGSGNGTVGGSNSQLQFNLSGSFAGDPDLTWDAGNNKLVTANLSVSANANVGNVNATNVNVSANLRPNAIYTDHYYYANGYVFGGGGGNGTPGGATTQVQFNDAGAFGGNTGFTFNKTSGVFTSPFLAGNGNGLSNIQGANISGFVPNANVANTALAVAGANVTGAVSFAGTANSVAVANVVGIGNIATLALDGNTSNVLYGNGVFAAVSSNPFNQELNTTDNVQFANITSTDAIRFSNSGNIVGALGYAPTFVSIEGYQGNSVNITANDVHTWSFDQYGTLYFPGNTIAVDDIEGTNNFGFETPANVGFGILTDLGNNEWSFGADGNLTLPGNTFAVNYANGQQVNISGGSGNTGNVTFDNQIVIGTGDSGGFGGLYLAPGNTEQLANSAYFRVRGGDVPTHLHFDTGNNAYFDQYFGDDNKYVKLEAGTSGNIVIGTDNNGQKWTFGDNGDTTVPGNIQSITTGFSFTSNISDVDTTTVANAVIVTFVTSSLFPAPVTGQVTISDVVGTTETNGTWYFEAVEANQIQLYYDEALQYPVDGAGWPAYVSGGLAVAAGYNDLSITGGNVSITTNNGDSWTFANNGSLTLPSATGPGSSAGYIQTANAYPTLVAYGSGGHGGPELDWMDSDDPANAFGNNSVLRHTMFLNDEGLFVGFNENEVANIPTVNWNFNPNGTILFPTLTVDLHNGGVQNAQTLQFGDNSQQAVITGPTPPIGTGQNAQRLIIQGQRGDTTGEGGDVYIWAGDADNYAGDIKIYAGDADNVSLGYGGYINISGGTGFNEGGYVNITGGRSTNSAGAYASVVGGIGATTGGSANLVGGQGSIGGNAYVQGGYGGGSGGHVNITGGVAGNGLAEYGNVNINSGASSWTFDNTGNLTFPNGSVFAGNVVTTPTSINGTVNPFVWHFNDNVIGSSTTQLEWNSLDTDQNQWYLSTDSKSKYWLFDSTTKAMGYIGDGGSGALATVTFGNSVNGGAGTVHDIQLTTSTSGNIYNKAGNSTWTFDNTGNLTLPTISTGEGTDEQAIISSQRKVIPPNRYSAVIDGATPTIVYTASPGSLSLKTTLVVQHAGFGLEMFDVSAVSAGADVMYSVSNRLNATGEDDTTVVVDWDVTQLAITLTINSGATTSYVTYDSTEFGIAVD